MIRRDSGNTNGGLLEKSPLLGNLKFPAAAPYSASSPERESEGYSWDFCIVVSANSDGASKILDDLNKVGLEIYSYNSIEKTDIIIKIRASVKRLSEHARSIGYSMLLDDIRLKEAAEAGIPNKSGGYIVQPLLINHQPDITEIKPHEFIYSQFPGENDVHILPLFAHADGLPHPFGSVHRIKLISSIIEKDAGINLYKLSHEGVVSGYFPLKDEVVANDLIEKISNFKILPWQLPFDEIKNYLGERIGLYYLFLSHITTFMVPLAALGALVFIILLAQSALNTGSWITAIYALVVCIWAQSMIEFWRRKQAAIAMQWGMVGFNSDEIDLPTFEGTIMDSVIDGRPTLYFSEKEKLIRQGISAVGVLGTLLVVTVSLAAFFIVRLIFGSFLTYLIQAVVIQIMNGVFMKFAVWLTSRENHRFESQFEESLIAKLFLFQFLNSYSMLFYIAFFRTMIGDYCPGGMGCTGELSLALFVIFGFRLIVSNAEELLWPIIEPHVRILMKQAKHRFLQWYNEEFPDQLPETTPTRGFVESVQKSLEEEVAFEKQKERKKQMMEVMSKTEKEFNLDVYHRLRSTVEEYSELAIQFGYVTFFVAAFPLAPLFALASNYFKIRIVAFNLLSNLRRPIPASAEDIGAWLTVLQIISVVSVVTNSGIICFTINTTGTDMIGSFNLFITMQYMLFALMGIAAYLVPNVPSSVPIQLQRQEVLIRKIIKGTPDAEKRVFIPSNKGSLNILDDEDSDPFRRDIPKQITNLDI